MVRKISRVLTALVLVISLCGVGVVCVDASPDFDRAEDVTVAPADESTGLLGWFEHFVDLIVTALSGATCDEQTPEACDTGDQGGSIDVNG